MKGNNEQDDQKSPMFKDSEVGDAVWDFALGCGEIVEVSNSGGNWPIKVRFRSDHIDTYDLNGNSSTVPNTEPTLFYSKLEFEIPPAPLRKVEKWKWLTRDDAGNLYITESHYSGSRDYEEQTSIKGGLIQKLDASCITLFEDEHAVRQTKEKTPGPVGNSDQAKQIVDCVKTNSCSTVCPYDNSKDWVRLYVPSNCIRSGVDLPPHTLVRCCK